MNTDEVAHQFAAKAESADHVLIRNKDGEVDFLAYEDESDFPFHNGPRCSVCGEAWCVWCNDEVEKCKGKAA